jgi:hypothetical protein
MSCEQPAPPQDSCTAHRIQHNPRAPIPSPFSKRLVTIFPQRFRPAGIARRRNRQPGVSSVNDAAPTRAFSEGSALLPSNSHLTDNTGFRDFVTPLFSISCTLFRTLFLQVVCSQSVPQNDGGYTPKFYRSLKTLLEVFNLSPTSLNTYAAEIEDGSRHAVTGVELEHRMGWG